MLAVVKMRRSAHSRELREYRIGSQGLEMLQVLRDYRGVLSGMPEVRVDIPGLTEGEVELLRVVVRSNGATETELALETRLADDLVQQRLRRLVELGHAVATTEPRGTIYTAATGRR
jgi:hypothetical protein